MKHYLRFMLVLLLSTVWCVGGYSQETVTFTAGTDKGSKTNVNSISDDQMSKDGVTISSTRALLGVTPYKFYKKTKRGAQPTTEITVESGNIIKIVFKGADTSNPVSGFKVIGSNGSYECSGNVGTWTGSSNKVTFNNPPYDGDQAFVSSIEVTYTQGQTKTLKSLAISGTPTKTTYDDGEVFDPTGLVVTGTYDDNTTAKITDGITWTKNPATLAVGNTSCSVIATVNGVPSPVYEVTGLTVVKSSKPIVFDFTADPNAWKITPLGKNSLDGNNVVAGKKLIVDDVVMTATNGNNNGTCIYKSTSSVNLRVYTGGGSITFTAPEGYNLSNVTFDFDNTGTFSASEQTWKTPNWTGNAHAVTFTCTKNIQVNTATIKLVAATPVTPEVTSGTIKFIAQDTDGGYYATFSSDKDVVFTNDVVVSGVSITGGKLSLNNLNSADCDVTDAKVGYETGIVENGYYVPFNTGVLVYSTDATATYYFPKTTQAVTLPANQLKPAPAKGGEFTPEDGYKYYKLAYDNYSARTGLGFYWGAENGGAFNVKAGTAYLAVPTSESNAKGFAFDGETTGIENVNVAANQSKTIYNLNGQRVSNMSQAGLYIVNGKKVVIRK